MLRADVTKFDDQRARIRTAEYFRSLYALKYSRQAAAVARWYYGLRTWNVEKLVFTATTGRSGTLTLTRIFEGIPGCRAVHEPYPIMHDAALRAASYGDMDSLDRFYRAKAINILRAAAGHRYYVEASHLFIKTFVGHAARDFGSRLAVVHLVRPPIEVAMSIYRLQGHPGTERGNRWYLDYRAPLNHIRIHDALEGGEFSHPFYKALWYWFETESRVREWQQRLPSVPFIRFETDWFNDPDRVLALANGLNISVERRLVDSLAGVREHTRDDEKRISGLPLDEAHRMFDHFQGLLSRRYPETAAILRDTGKT